ncbi:MAG: sigma 54-interacting transcriptional regulator [Polyangiaceae bacterium]
MEDRTVPRRLPGLPVKSVRVEVVAGPDRGRQLTFQDTALTIGTAQGNELVLTDPTVSRYHLELERAADRILLRDLGSTNGTSVGGVSFRDAAVSIPPGTTVTVGDSSLRLEDDVVVMVDHAAPDVLGGLRGRSVAARRLFSAMMRVASSNVPVLLYGESGTGKELIARALHDLGGAGRPLSTVDCAALVPSLFASELFGHERGAFTGAERRHEGAFVRANGGTVFLDEIGELSAELQSSLLGVVERRRVRRVGGSEEIPVDVRIISATHRDLRSEVNAGRFRLDLFYRLAVVLIRVPPLRERSEDIPLLVEHFLREAGYDGPSESVFPPEEMSRLSAHDWPGNIRELRNVVEAALVLGADQSLAEIAGGAGQVQGFSNDEPFASLYGLTYKDARRSVLDRFEHDYLKNLLANTGGNVRQAARDAKMDRSYLIDLLKRHGLP